jgi:UDP-3-O-[3-hydroxymyristoyl] glucosamine N-acyltransferase
MRVSELASKLSLTFKGEDFEIRSINTLKESKSDEISFFESKKYLADLSSTNAGAVFIKEGDISDLASNVGAIVCENPYLSMARATEFFAKKLIRKSVKPTISKSAYIGERVHIGNSSMIGDDVIILDGAYIGEDVSIGENCIIHPNVTIYNDTIIGNNVIIHSGTVIGSDGFGYAHTKEGKHIKIHHNGKVVIEDDVEIGSNTSIDRGVFGKTLIKSGTKIDNLIQIGHNCDIGESCIIVSQTGISGSTKLGQNVVMGGQSATAGHLEIGAAATVAARGGVTKSIEGGKVYSGFPLMIHSDWLKLQAKISKYFKKGKI